jgi:hypothetical protein
LSDLTKTHTTVGITSLFIMKKLFLSCLSLLIFLPSNLKAQNDGAAAAAAGILAIGAAIASVENYKEQLELTATEWFLKEHSDIENFQLRTLDLQGKKLKDMSATSVITFKIQELLPEQLPKKVFAPTQKELNQALRKKWILLAFTSPGWINDYGVNISKLKWILVDQEEWLNMMVTYVMAASGESNVEEVRKNIMNGKIVNKGVRNGGLAIPFYTIGNDMYLSADYNEDMKFVYNERSLGIYLKSTQDLVQMSRNVVIDIHNFFYGE